MATQRRSADAVALQVGHGLPEQPHVVLEATEGQVAAVAQQTSNALTTGSSAGAARVVVIDGESSLSNVRRDPAYGASPALLVQAGGHLLDSQPVPGRLARGGVASLADGVRPPVRTPEVALREVAAARLAGVVPGLVPATTDRDVHAELPDCLPLGVLLPVAQAVPPSLRRLVAGPRLAPVNPRSGARLTRLRSLTALLDRRIRVPSLAKTFVVRVAEACGLRRTVTSTVLPLRRTLGFHAQILSIAQATH